MYYTPSKVRDIETLTQTSVNDSIISRIHELGIYRKPIKSTHRGKRAVFFIRLKIKIVLTPIPKYLLGSQIGTMCVYKQSLVETVTT